MAKRILNRLRQRPGAVLLIIFLFHALNNLVIVARDRLPFDITQAWLFASSGEMLRSISQRDPASFMSALIGSHPPLHRLVSLPFYLMFGYSPKVAVLSVLPAALVLIISMYVIGKELQDSDMGLLAAGLTMLLPGVFILSRTYWTEFTLMATVALSLAVMLKTKGFSHRGYTFAFGMSIGLGLLAKWTFPVFAVGPCLLYVYQSYRKIGSKNLKRESVRRGSWLLLSVVLGLLLASLWYLQNPELLTGDLKRITLIDQVFIVRDDSHTPEVRKEGDARRIFSTENILFYVRELYSLQLKPVFFIMGLASGLYLLITKHRAALFPTPWFLLPYAIFTFGITDAKAARFILPYLPAFALIIAIAATSLKPRYRDAAIAILLAGGLLQFFALSSFSFTF